MEKEKNNTQVIVQPNDKGGFLPYLSAFFTGAVTRDVVKDSVLEIIELEEKPVVGVKSLYKSLTNLFKKEPREIALKETKETFTTKKGKSALGVALLAEFGSILPGAAVGYLAFKPKQDPIIVSSENLSKNNKVTSVSEAKHDGVINEKSLEKSL